jgi:predicted secreted hydrolase
MRVRASGADHSGAQPVDLAVDLTFATGRNYLLQGYDGAVPLVAGLGTRYYSIPALIVDGAASHIILGGERIALEGGTLWMDHQWGTGLTPTGSPRHESVRAAANLQPAPVPGWDFFVMHLKGNYSITLNSVHTAENMPFVHQTGPVPPGPMQAAVTGKYMDAYGVCFNVSGQLTIDDWRKSDHSPNPAKYINTETWMPHGWFSN